MEVNTPSSERLSFGLLPEPEGRQRSFLTSAIVNGSILTIILLVSIFLKPSLVKHQFEQTTLLAPVPEPEKPKISQPKLPPPPPPEQVKLEQPKIVLPKMEPKPEPKPVVMESKVQAPVLKTAQPKIALAPQPKAALAMASASPANQPQAKVGGVNLGQSYSTTMNPNSQRAVAAIGSPNGAVAATGMHGAVGSTGLGNGQRVGGPGGVTGRVGSAGIPGATAGGGVAMGRVASAGIPQQQVAAAAAPRVTASPVSTNLEVLSKPAVQYTTEARQLKVQGDVVLRVTFTAAGRVQVQGVVRGLGHGLDQEAERVAQQIRFRPATRNGQPVDLTTNITITFQLA